MEANAPGFRADEVGAAPISSNGATGIAEQVSHAGRSQAVNQRLEGRDVRVDSAVGLGPERKRRRVRELAGADRVEVALGRLEIRVAEHVFDGDRIEHAGEQGAGGVAEVVEAQRRKAGAVAGGDVPPPERRGVEPVSRGVAEHVVGVVGEVGSLRLPVESGERLVGERHVADAAALRGALDRAGERSLDDEDALRPADVAPAEDDELAAPQAGVSGDAQQFAELAVIGPQRLDRFGGVVRTGGPPRSAFGRSRQGLDLLDREDLEPAGAILAALGAGGEGAAGYQLGINLSRRRQVDTPPPEPGRKPSHSETILGPVGPVGAGGGRASPDPPLLRRVTREPDASALADLCIMIF